MEVNFDDFDSSNQSQLTLCARIVDEIQNLVWTYFQNAKMSSLYFVLGSSNEEKHSESPAEGNNAQRNILRRIFSGNTTNVFLFFIVFSYILFLFIGNFAILMIIALQVVYLFYMDRILTKSRQCPPIRGKTTCCDCQRQVSERKPRVSEDKGEEDTV